MQKRRDSRTREAFRNQLGLKATISALPTDKPSTKHILGRVALGHYRKLSRRLATLRGKFSMKLPVTGIAARTSSVSNFVPQKRVRAGTNFSLRVGGRISARAGLSKEAIEIEAIRRQTPFEVYRPKL